MLQLFQTRKMFNFLIEHFKHLLLQFIGRVGSLVSFRGIRGKP